MRLFSLPAMVLGIVLAIVFFEGYGYVTRPSVPKPIAVVVDVLAPGVEIGAHVSDARHTVAAMSYVPHVGFVGLPASRKSYLPNGEAVSFSQVRLLLDERTRSRPQVDPGKSRVDAVEIVTGQPSAAGQLGTEFAMLFRRPPRDGCIRGADEDHAREVHVWTTPNDRGGLAIVTDYSPTPASHADKPVLTSVFAFSGKFDGSRTLRASYIDAGCADSAAQASSPPSEIVLAAAAEDSLTAALSDSLAPSLGFVVGQSGAAIESLNACDDPVDSRGWETGVTSILEIPLPPGFTASSQTGQTTVRWTGPGGWITASADRHGAATGVITSDCDVFVSGAPTHVELGSTSYGRSVHALIKPSDAPAIEVDGGSKTIEGQAQILHAIRYAHISMSWGRPQ